MDSENSLMEELQSLQKKLGRKQSFEDADSSIQSILCDRYLTSSPALRKSIYSIVCRVATVLQTRYTAPGFLLAGLRLFEQAEGMVSETSEKEHLKNCIARAREHLHEVEIEVPVARQPDSRYLFEGHLTVQPEPAPPAWLVAQNLLTTLAVAQDWASVSESSGGHEENSNAAENVRSAEVPESVRELVNSVQEIGDFLDLDNVIEASLQGILSTSRTITFISNRKDGLKEGVTQVFGDSCHGYCVNQLTKDFRAQMEEVEEDLTQEVMDAMLGDLKRLVQACKVDEFNECIESIKAESKELAEWVLASKPDLWSNAFFKGLRYGNYSSSALETFNSCVATRYEPSVMQLVDIYSRRETSNSWREILTPSTNLKVQEDITKARGLDVISSTGSVFEVHDNTIHVVNIETWECTCRRWQVMGMPCVHALAVFDRTNASMYDYFSKYFTTKCYRLVYSLSIILIPDAGRPGLLVPVDIPDASSSPPPRRSRRMAGRPKERPDDPRITVKRAIRCGKCQGVGHNKQTCKASL